jgi:hypothetical protein
VDDLVLIPLGVKVALSMITAEVMTESRAKAQEVIRQGKPVNRIAAAIILAIWLILAALVIAFMLRLFKG